MKLYLHQNGTEMYLIRKSAVAKRFVRTLKNKIHKDMAEIASNVYINKLDKTNGKYNSSHHKAMEIVLSTMTKILNLILVIVRE